MRWALLGALALNLVGCAAWRPATAPLRTVAEPARCAAPVETLLVMMPGTHSLPEEFIAEGFVQAVRERRLAVDVLLVDAHRGYFRARSIVDRLHADVVQPARAKGYRHIWFVGISLGGVAAMLYADDHPGAIDGIVLIAPFLGSPLVAREIRAAGGLAAWQAPARPAGGDLDATLWRWLQAQTGKPTLPLYLAYGLDDRFVFNDEVLAQALPASHVFTIEGGHDWDAWTPLWRSMLAELPFARCPQSAAG